MKKFKRILSLDGGGIRGIIPGRILCVLEKKLQDRTQNPEARISDFFDMIAGTSTGGILACICMIPDEKNKNKSKFSAEEILNIYLKDGSEIFHTPFFQKIKNLGGIFDEKYPAKNLEKILKNYMGDVKLSQLLKPSLITSYDMTRRKPIFFRQQKAKKDKSKDFRIRDIARATAAAPTYFELAHIRSISGEMYSLIDGGLVANNPALCAYAEAREIFSIKEKKKITASDMVIFSIGTGENKKPYLYDNVKDWGMVDWIKPILDILFSAGPETVDFQLKQIFEANNKISQYFRIKSALPDSINPEMDDTTDENIKALDDFGKTLAYDNDDELERLLDMLLMEDNEEETETKESLEV